MGWKARILLLPLGLPFIWHECHLTWGFTFYRFIIRYLWYFFALDSRTYTFGCLWCQVALLECMLSHWYQSSSLFPHPKNSVNLWDWVGVLVAYSSFCIHIFPCVEVIFKHGSTDIVICLCCTSIANCLFMTCSDDGSIVSTNSSKVDMTCIF